MQNALVPDPVWFVVVAYPEAATATKAVEALSQAGFRGVVAVNPESTRTAMSAGVSPFGIGDIKVVHTPGNLGYGAAVNYAVLECAPEDAAWILIANDDCLPSERALSWLREQVKRNDADILAFPYVDGDRQRARSTGLAPSIPTAIATLVFGERLASLLSPAKLPKGAFFAVRLSEFTSIQGFDANYFLYYEEIDLFSRLLARKARIAWAPEGAMVQHQGGGATASVTSDAREILGVSLAHIVRTHSRSPWQYRLTSVLMFLVLCRVFLTAYLVRRDETAGARATLVGFVRRTKDPTYDVPERRLTDIPSWQRRRIADLGGRSRGS